MNKYMTDFSPKCGSITSAFWHFAVALTEYILVPLAFISLIAGIGSELASTLPSGSIIDYESVLKSVSVYLRSFMVYSIPLLFLSIFIGYYPAGNYARIPFKFIASLYLSIMLLMFTDCGNLFTEMEGGIAAVPEITNIQMTIHIQSAIYILSFISFIKGFVAFAEFSDNRKTYLKNLAKKLGKDDYDEDD